MPSEYLYRYEHTAGEDSVFIHLRKFKILRRTPAGCWIELWYHKEKFQLAGTRKKWACESTEIAAESFIHRKRKQIGILKSQLLGAEQALEHATTRRSNGESIEGRTCTIPSDTAGLFGFNIE